MSYVIVDVESDGPIPAEFSMVCFGAVVFDDQLDKTFTPDLRPIRSGGSGSERLHAGPAHGFR
jgi:hypothetical protein